MGAIFGSKLGYGVIVNHSSFQIEYFIYGAHQQTLVDKSVLDAAPQLDANPSGVKFSGFKYTKNVEKAHKYKEASIIVGPNSKSNAGLSRVKFGENRITIRVTIQEKIVKYFVTDLVINADDDICYLITPNLTVRNMARKEIDKLIRQNPEHVPGYTGPTKGQTGSGEGQGVEVEGEVEVEELTDAQREERQIEKILKKQFGSTGELQNELLLALKQSSIKEEEKKEQVKVEEGLTEEKGVKLEVVLEVKELEKVEEVQTGQQEVDIVAQVEKGVDNLSLEKKEE